MTTDTSERGLEGLICTALTGAPCDPGVPANRVQQHPATFAAGWICGLPADYDLDRSSTGGRRAASERRAAGAGAAPAATPPTAASAGRSARAPRGARTPVEIRPEWYY